MRNTTQSKGRTLSRTGRWRLRGGHVGCFGLALTRQARIARSYATGFLASLLAFGPLGLFLEWFLPGDGPYEFVVSLLSSPLLLIGILLVYQSRATSANSLERAGVVSRGIALFTLALFFEIQVFTYVPEIARRVGPWSDLRGLLLAKATQVEKAREALGVPADRPLSLTEVKTIDERVLTPRPTFIFPLVNQTVEVRLMSGTYPYVGVDYGNGRNCIFDLESMRATECD